MLNRKGAQTSFLTILITRGGEIGWIAPGSAGVQGVFSSFLHGKEEDGSYLLLQKTVVETVPFKYRSVTDPTQIYHNKY